RTKRSSTGTSFGDKKFDEQVPLATTYGLPPTHNNDQGTTDMKNMRRTILELQEQLWQVTLQQDKKTSVLRIPQDKTNNPDGMLRDSVDQDTIKERRRRVRLPAFTLSDMQKAREWLMKYNSLTHHICFSETEKLADLEVRLKGDALSSFIYLPEEDKRTWKRLERAQCEWYSLNRSYREVARKAEVHLEVMLISYLKAVVNPEMRKAIVYRGPKTYTQAVDICVEVKTDFLTDQYHPTVKTLTEFTQQNYQSRDNRQKGNSQQSERGWDQVQEKRSCFTCKKVGHLKIDCWLNKKKNIRHHNNQETTNQQEETPVEEIINIFDYLFGNNQQEQTAQQERNRFKIRIKCNNQKV
ncbi:hypothetical protein A0J61_11399, partial [Choanephora cucurbitarum]